jgi:hypothetical protein
MIDRTARRHETECGPRTAQAKISALSAGKLPSSIAGAASKTTARTRSLPMPRNQRPRGAIPVQIARKMGALGGGGPQGPGAVRAWPIFWNRVH